MRWWRWGVRHRLIAQVYDLLDEARGGYVGRHGRRNCSAGAVRGRGGRADIAERRICWQRRLQVGEDTLPHRWR